MKRRTKRPIQFKVRAYELWHKGTPAKQAFLTACEEFALPGTVAMLDHAHSYMYTYQKDIAEAVANNDPVITALCEQADLIDDNGNLLHR